MTQDKVRPDHLRSLAVVIMVLVGLGLAVPGLWLIAAGGSPYYVLAGAGLAAAGFLLWRRLAQGVAMFIAVTLGTLLWALWEAGLDFWALLPRLNLFVPLGLLILLVCRRSWWPRLKHHHVRARWAAPAIAAAVITLIVLTTLLHDRGAVAAAVADNGEIRASDGEWPVVGGDNGKTGFSRLRQITPGNVGELELAWKVHLGFPPSKGSAMLGMPGVLEATPLMVGDKLYMCNMNNEVMALDPETGRTIWRFDPKIDSSGVIIHICRGVAFYRQPGATGPCSERIISYTLDARMFALDAATGRRCRDFGRNGEVDVSKGMGATEKGYYYLSAAPSIVGGKVIIAGSVLDGQHTTEPSGAIRAYDAVTGEFAWAWDMGRPDDHGMPSPGQSFTLGTPNAWGHITGDDRLGLAYVPLGNATPDYVSSHRSPVMNEFTDAVVALDVRTGALRWKYQTIHRDVWDYDVASPPTLVDFPTARGQRPALIQPTKRGEFFVLDRATGEPLVKTVEVPVPQKPVPGEIVSPTQPYPVGMPSLNRERLTEADMWGMTAFDQLWCRIKFRGARYDGQFTPIGLNPTIIYPGYMGGSEWPGVSIDPERKVMVANISHFAMYNQLIDRAAADKLDIPVFKVGGRPASKEWTPQRDTPYAARIQGFLSPLGTPCTKPPYTELAAIDLKTRKILWRRPLGTARDSGPGSLKSMLRIPMGVPAMGGPLVTGSGLIFIAATQERSFRAFDLASGRKLWEARLPAGGHASPMTYVSRRTGRQFVVIPASGHFWMKSGQADYLMAYALPKTK